MNKKTWKVLGASGFALFMGIGTLCGVLLAPMHSAQVNTSTRDASQTLSAEEKLLSGSGLGLDPENDMVLGSTKSGVEIRFHGRALTGNWDYNAFTSNYVSDKFSGSGNFHNLSGYLYVTMGTYNDSPVNWIIIGRNPDLNTIACTNTYAQSTETITNFLNFVDYSTYANELQNQIENSTPAGMAINQEISNQYINTVSGISRSYSHTISAYGSPAAQDEIPENCVLCICANYLGITSFAPTSRYSNNYSGSTLHSVINNLYSSGLNLTDDQKERMKPQSLYTLHYHGGSTIDDQYLFPLAGRSTSETFYIGRYLTSDSARDIRYYWWTRSGATTYTDEGYWVHIGGWINIGQGGNIGVRPAFVLSLE